MVGPAIAPLLSHVPQHTQTHTGAPGGEEPEGANRAGVCVQQQQAYRSSSPDVHWKGLRGHPDRALSGSTENLSTSQAPGAVFPVEIFRLVAKFGTPVPGWMTVVRSFAVFAVWLATVVAQTSGAFGQTPECEDNQFYDIETSRCAYCPGGKEVARERLSAWEPACTDCSTGYASGNGTCERCEPGKQPDPTATVCTRCVDNTVSWDGSECVPCAEGEVSSDDRSTCTPPPTPPAPEGTSNASTLHVVGLGLVYCLAFLSCKM